MANSPSTPAIEALAAEIGESIYIDVAKWHLYLAEAHLHTPLAESLYPLLSEPLQEDDVLARLRSISVPLGGGKVQVSLADLVPVSCQIRLLDLLEEYQRNL